jgi:hypothetical protein
MSKTNLLLSFFLLFSVIVTAQVEQWEEVKSYEGRFRILFPGTPTLNVDTIETAVGKLAYHVHFYQPTEDNPDNLVYMLSYCDYPEETFHADSTDLVNEFFEATVSSSVEAVDGELAYSSERSYLDHPGRLWRINYLEDNAVIKTRAFLVGQRYYALQVVTYREKSLNPSSDKFIESIKIIE